MAASTPTWWRRRGAAALALLPLSALFYGLSAIRRLCYRSGLCRSQGAPVPVVVVGNIAVGGSGKTPVVVWLVDALRSAGRSPGIVSRGYGRKDETVRVVGAEDPPELVGDEPRLLSQLTGAPVVVGAKRPAAIEQLLQSSPQVDVIISDDGLQHLAMARDAQVVVLDEQVLGNRLLLPAGPLREPVSRLASATLLLVHGDVSAGLAADLPGVPTETMVLVGERFECVADRTMHRTAADFPLKRVHAVAGIGRPARFFDQLRRMGFDVIEHPFPDHHDYVPSDLAFDLDAPILITEKDAVKCAAFAPADTWVFPVRAQIPRTALQPIIDALDRHGRQTA